MLLLVVYDGLLVTVLQLLPDLVSQEYIRVPPRVVALHVRVVVVPCGIVISLGCVVIDGGPAKYKKPSKF